MNAVAIKKSQEEILISGNTQQGIVNLNGEKFFPKSVFQNFYFVDPLLFTLINDIVMMSFIGNCPVDL
ncbi:hypothetical protein T05_13907 [Trichinella murrelli]|uniref:Uncharacterized protein n=1 Tax=Trichinella murrelli TaxID=144512 RepID=A0A0V0TQJ6_9BILA|nr:hypothetical protein T05_13907 [Trichinella murrelli]